MSTIDRLLNREIAAENLGWITLVEMDSICPSCAKSMRKRGMVRVSVLGMVTALLEAQKGGPGNIEDLIKYWRTKEHPFSECKKWISEHKGDEGYPDVKDPDAFCGKLKALTAD